MTALLSLRDRIPIRFLSLDLLDCVKKWTDSATLDHKPVKQKAMSPPLNTGHQGVGEGLVAGALVAGLDHNGLAPGKPARKQQHHLPRLHYLPHVAI